MTLRAAATQNDQAETLNLFCAQEDEAWRIYLSPRWIPKYLAASLDRHGEAFPVLLDYEDLDRRMRKHGAEYEKRVSTLGDVELTANGRAAHALAEWLSTALASGMRTATEE
jgi:hypothetical protein